MKELNKTHVIYKNLHEIKGEILRDYNGKFEIVGRLKVGYQIRETQIRFRNIDDYEAYIIALDEGYDTKDAIFNGYVYKKKHSSI